MDVPKSLLVQTLTAATNSFPIDHIENCIGCLAYTLEHAKFRNVCVSDNDAFGCALEADRGDHHHVTLVLILPVDLYETTDDELQAFVQVLIESDDHIDDLVRALNGSLLDVASICFDPINGRCRIHHPQDILHACDDHDKPVHFFIPAGTDTAVPADECPVELQMAPLALANMVCA